MADLRHSKKLSTNYLYFIIFTEFRKNIIGNVIADEHFENLILLKVTFKFN